MSCAPRCNCKRDLGTALQSTRHFHKKTFHPNIFRSYTKSDSTAKNRHWIPDCVGLLNSCLASVRTTVGLKLTGSARRSFRYCIVHGSFTKFVWLFLLSLQLWENLDIRGSQRRGRRRPEKVCINVRALFVLCNNRNWFRLFWVKVSDDVFDSYAIIWSWKF